MMRKMIGAAVVMAAFAVPASANPAAGIVAGGQPQTDAVTPVHGWNHGCMLGPRGWWHYTRRGRSDGCGINPGGGHIWHFHGGRWGWWHPRQRRWHGH